MQNIDEHSKLDYIIQIYERQHYFIDRHETMAEKLLSVILILTTIISAIVTFNFSDIRNGYMIIPFCVYLICFLFSIYKIIDTIQPLSSKAIDTSTNFIEKSNKSWLEESLIYYRGIIKIKNGALNENKIPIVEYENLLSEENYSRDLIKQIFILAYYSDYKRESLEIAKNLTKITVLIGIICIVLFMYFSIFT